MTGRAAAVQGGLAALGLLAAHLTWQREPERAPGAVAVFEASKGDVTLVRYEDDQGSTDLTRGRGGNEPAAWLHIVTKSKDPKAKTPPDRDLAGGEAAVKVLDEFAPFVSPRAFGVLDAAKLKEIGLDAPKRKLEVTVKGDVRRYDIGQPTNATGGEAFLRDTRDGRVYLLPRGMLSELQNSSHLVDRRLHTFELGDFDRMVVSSGGKQKEFLQVGRESRSTAGFAPAKAPDKRDQMAKNWHDNLWRLFPADLLGRGEQPPGGKPNVQMRVDYYDGKTQVGWIEIARVDANAGGVSDESSAAGEMYARTEHTANWAKLHPSGQLLPDAQKLVAAP